MTTHDLLPTPIGIDLPRSATAPGWRPPGQIAFTATIEAFNLVISVDQFRDLLAVHSCIHVPNGRAAFAREGAVIVVLPLSDPELAGRGRVPPEAVSYLSAPRRFDKLGSPEAPLNCSVFFTDIANYGDPRRDDDDRRAIKDALYEMLQESFDDSNVPWASCVREDRGDGVLIVAPATVSTVALVDPLLPRLALKLKRYNRRVAAPVRIQLRGALHVGPVLQDPEGLSGQAIIHTARMLDASVLKDSLAATRADLAFMASAHVYDTVIRQSPGLVDAAAFRRVRYQVKEAKITSWMYLAGATRNRSRAVMRSA